VPVRGNCLPRNALRRIAETETETDDDVDAYIFTIAIELGVSRGATGVKQCRATLTLFHDD
jgi:hypothetical protein